MRISDWSSDVCSSDLGVGVEGDTRAVLERHRTDFADFAGKLGHWYRPASEHAQPIEAEAGEHDQPGRDRKRVVKGKSGSVSIELGCRRIIKQKNNTHAR